MIGSGEGETQEKIDAEKDGDDAEHWDETLYGGEVLVLSEDVGTSPARTDLASRSWVMAIRRIIKGMMKSPSSCQRYFFIVLSGVRFAICIPFISSVISSAPRFKKGRKCGYILRATPDTPF